MDMKTGRSYLSEAVQSVVVAPECMVVEQFEFLFLDQVLDYPSHAFVCK